MLKKILSNRISILYFIPLILGLLTTLSFEPFNLLFINFLILPVFFI